MIIKLCLLLMVATLSQIYWEAKLDSVRLAGEPGSLITVNIWVPVFGPQWRK